MAGFAGSVEVGFTMISIMRHQWCAPEGQLYPVKRVAWHWHRFARFYYDRFVRPELRPLGCELILAGVSPEWNGMGFYSHAVTMRAPEFTPRVVKDWLWGSIGDGAAHAAAPEFQDRDNIWNHAQGEIMNPGGTAFSIAHSVAESLEADPIHSVSPILQVGIVRADETVFRSLRRERRGAWTIAGERESLPMPIFTTWAAFKEAIAASELDASAAIT
jgi:hypothetical protein